MEEAMLAAGGFAALALGVLVAGLISELLAGLPQPNIAQSLPRSEV